MKAGLIGLLLFLSACATPSIKVGKTNDIKILIRNSGELDQMYQLAVKGFLDPIENGFQQEQPEKVKVWKAKVEQFLHKKVYEDPQLMDQLVALYDKNYSHEEILEILRFQESKVGRKVREIKPIIFGEAYKIGESWGRSITEDFENEIRNGSLDVASQNHPK